jgi:flagellar basal-body rod protein FlgB
MTTTFRDTIGLHANALILRETRNEVLASNIANAATPNFKARDFDFEMALRQATAGGPLRQTDGRHVSSATGIDGTMGYRVPVTESLDGNTVEPGVEQMEFSENTLRYQTSLQLLNRRISGLMTAIKGE